MRKHLRVEDAPERSLQLILHSGAGGLPLPAVKVSAIVGANAFPSHTMHSCHVPIECKADAMENLEPWQYALIAAGALTVGLGKSGLPGIGNLAVVFLAIAVPAKASVGLLLPILVAADIFAVAIYRKHTLWPYIFKLAPWTIAGIFCGYFVFSRVNDAQVRTLIGIILLTMTAVHFIRKRMRAKSLKEDTLLQQKTFIAATGMIGGFATMVANAGGPVAALYFIAAGLPKYAFIGTAAWFFFLVNVFKIPFMMDLGIINFDSMKLSLSFMIFAVAGALIAPLLVKHINQRVFEVLIWVFVVIGGLKLILP